MRVPESMSLRRDYCAEDAIESPAFLRGVADTAPERSVTTERSLGASPTATAAATAGPAKPFVPFAPQHPTPQPVGNVVDDAFAGYYGYDVEPTGLFGKKKKASSVKVEGKKGGMVANLKAAKSKADEAVLKGKQLAKKGKAAAAKVAAGAKSAAKAAGDTMVGLGNFDYRVYSTDFSAILCVAKKDKGTTPNDKYNFQAFAEGWYGKEKVSQVAAAQEKRMSRIESQVKNQKGRDSKTIQRTIAGRNAVCLGFAQVEASDVTNERFGDVIFQNTGAEVAGIPTLVHIEATNGEEGMAPITGLVMEALDTDGIQTNDEGNIDFNFASIDEIEGENAYTGSMTPDETNFKFVACVHGVHVDGDKTLHVGPKILVPASKGAKKRSDDAMEDLREYGIVTENGIESALAHAIKGEKLDLLLLWTSWKLALGAKRLADSKLGKAEKAAVAEIFGSADGMATQNSFSEAVEAEEFAAINLTTVA